jgi:hypothetical protein
MRHFLDTNTVLVTAIVFGSLVLFLWTPGEPVDWSYTGPLFVIVAVAVLAGEVIVGWCFRRLPPDSATSPESPLPQPTAGTP